MTTACDPRCMSSTAPVSACRCSCGGANHGRLAGTAAAGGGEVGGPAPAPQEPAPQEPAPQGPAAGVAAASTTTAGDDPFPAVASLIDYLDPDRFQVEPQEGGQMSLSWTVLERATGRRFILKRGVEAHSSQSEIAVGRLLRLVNDTQATDPDADHAADLTGPQVRYAAPDSTDFVLVQHVDDNPDDGVLLAPGLASTATAEDARELVRRLHDPLQPLEIVIRDFVTDNPDRHGGNFLVMSVARRPGRVKLAPIDHARALLGAAGDDQATWFRGVPPQLWLEVRRQVTTLGEFYRDQPTAGQLRRRIMLYLAVLAVDEGRVGRRQMTAAYDRLVVAWTAAARRVDLDDLGEGYAYRATGLMAARLAALRRNRADHLWLLTGNAG
jgi:hypothetical protein